MKKNGFGNLNKIRKRLCEALSYFMLNYLRIINEFETDTVYCL